RKPSPLFAARCADCHGPHAKGVRGPGLPTPSIPAPAHRGGFPPGPHARAGPEGKGVRGPDLTTLWIRGATDERVFAAVRNGVAGSIMPPSVAPDTELWAIVA